MQLPRPIKNSLLPLLLVFAAQKVCAQLAPATDFFNSGAQFYISNNIPTALARTESGLKLYPDDEKLQKLEKLLKQQHLPMLNKLISVVLKRIQLSMMSSIILLEVKFYYMFQE